MEFRTSDPLSLLGMEEQKRYAGTKRRRDVLSAVVAHGGRAMLSRRITRLQKVMKIHNPLHLYSASLAAILAPTTTGSAFDLCANVAQVCVVLLIPQG